MDLSVKNQILSKKPIIKFSLNKPLNILASLIEGNQYVQFHQLIINHTSIKDLKEKANYNLTTNESLNNKRIQKQFKNWMQFSDPVTFEKIFDNSTRPLGLSNVISWSPDGTMLALGTTKIQTWLLNPINNDSKIQSSLNNYQNEIEKKYRLKHHKYFNFDFIQIRQIVWTPDSSHLICSGVHNTLSIIAQNVQTGQRKSISVQSMIASIGFDPFGKYLSVLTCHNKVQIYTNFTVLQKSINLSSSKKKQAFTVKQIRGMDWSPDFSSIVLPSLQDNKISIGISLSRNKNFQADNIYLGHHSSINSIKFNPNLYMYDKSKEIYCILALGDTMGYISLWKIPAGISELPQQKRKLQNKPLLLCRPHQQDQIIQQMEWDSTGTLLLINTHKNYLSLYKFDKQSILKNFGRALNILQKMQFVQQLYGVASIKDIQNQKFQVFNANIDYQDQFDQQEKLKQKAEQKDVNEVKNMTNQVNRINIAQSLNQSSMTSQMNRLNIVPKNINTTFIKTQQKVIIGQNQRKTIIPSKIIQQSQQTNQNISFSNNNNNSQIKYVPRTLKLKQMTTKLKQIYRINQDVILEVKNIAPPPNPVSNNNLSVTLFQLIQFREKLQNQNKVSENQNSQEKIIVQNNNNNTYDKILKNQRAFQGPVDYFNIISVDANLINQQSIYQQKLSKDKSKGKRKLIIVINQKNLYLFDYYLNLLQLPICVGSLNKFCVSQRLDIYGISTDGIIRSFNILGKKNKIQNQKFNSGGYNIGIFLDQAQKQKNYQGQQNQNNKYDPIQSIKIRQSDQRLYIKLRKTKEHYFLNCQTSLWVKLQFKQGKLAPGHSLRITEQQEKKNQAFFCQNKQILGYLLNSHNMKIANENKPKMKKEEQKISITQLQYNLIYYKKYQKDFELYGQALMSLMKEYSTRGMDQQLRDIIKNHFYDKSQVGYYIQNDQIRQSLWKKTKRLGGTIIQQFLLMEDIQ